MPEILKFGNFVLLIVAGFGAGIVTGLAGASAATVVTPLLVSFSPISAYVAIAVSLITDVFASFFSFLTYKKNGNINMKDGIALTITACIGAFLGSYLSSFFNNEALGGVGGFMTFLLGLKFLRDGLRMRKNAKNGIVQKKEKKVSKISQLDINPMVLSSVLGLFLGLVCGIVGAGGGLMILFVLTGVLNYDMKTAIGTSVLIMTFTALIGGVSHFFHMGSVNVLLLAMAMAITSASAVVGAKVAAKFANKTEEDILLTIVGSTFTVISVLMLLQKIRNV